METYVFKSSKGMPGAFILLDAPELEGESIFGCLDGPDQSQYKVGNE
jgi:hypothetical protein